MRKQWTTVGEPRKNATSYVPPTGIFTVVE
jgi:hypothetical protein